MCKIVTPVGAETDLYLAEDAELLPILQEAVGGYIKVLHIGDMVMIVDEEGLLKQKPKNPKASLGAGRPIVGTVVVMKRKIWESYDE